MSKILELLDNAATRTKIVTSDLYKRGKAVVQGTKEKSADLLRYTAGVDNIIEATNNVWAKAKSAFHFTKYQDRIDKIRLKIQAKENERGLLYEELDDLQTALSNLEDDRNREYFETTIGNTEAKIAGLTDAVTILHQKLEGLLRELEFEQTQK